MSGLMYLRSQNFRLAGVWFKAAGVVLIIAALTALLRLALSIRRRGWREGFLQRPFASVFSAVSLLLTLAVAAAQFQDKAKLQASLVAISMVAIFTAIVSFASYPVATFISLYRSYRESSTEERQQVKWPLWGTMIAVGVRVLLAIFGAALQLLVTFGLYVDIPSLVIMLPEVVGKLFYLLIPLSFAFAILKYRLMNIDVIIRRTVLYSILSAIVFGLYVAVVAGIGTLVVNFTAVKSQTMIIGSTIVVGLIAIPLRNRLQQMVDRNLFRERRDFALALRNISSAIGVSDLQVFLQKSAEQLQRAVQNRFVLLALRSESHYVAAAKVGIADEILGRLQIPIAELPEIDPESAPALRRLGTSLVLPLRAHSATLGFMALGTRLSDQEFGTDDLQFLAAAAQQIALGIDSARYRTEEADYAQARAMQQILLPTTFPKLNGFGISGMWQPARSVGGDYFDTIALGDGRVAVCIADVAGKGMPAALLMANLQAAVKATAASDVAPEQLCERVKRVVANNLAGGTFITFFYGVIDAASRTFAYCNAGHNPPILVREGGSEERLTTGGPALCRLFRDEPHAGGAVQLEPGDRLVLFTDGASEARRGEEEFGEERLTAVIAGNRFLPADALQAAIAGAITGFTGGNLDDDLTLVVVAAE
jgi:serine phosphatase RsbU (regulator of sigma subunit)